ncbi:MAG: M1 family metallopeptidase [Flavobacteriaceae bacterium]|nr:M1 family metallopeptidase [Flavobacteriaceae bacterium]
MFFLVLSSSCLWAQEQQAVDFKKIDAKLLIQPEEKSVEGKLRIQFTMLKFSDTVFLDAKNFDWVKWISAPKKKRMQLQKDKILFLGKFRKNKTYNFDIQYKTAPKKCMYFVGWENDAPNQVWTQGQGKYTSNWLPSLDDMRDKIVFNFSVIAPNGYMAIANGNLQEITKAEKHTKWVYRMQQPMSSYLAAIVIGKYLVKNLESNSGISMQLYYYPTDKHKVETTYAYTKEMFDFFEEYIGVPYPWQTYKQVPVFDFLYSGMENVGTTIFSDRFVVDSLAYNDQNYIQVNAHELAHQWFGDLVTETQSSEHWLHEGFATFYSWLAEGHIFGEQQYEYRVAEALSKLQHQESIAPLKALTNGTASSLVFYEKGALALHVLRNKLGDSIFRKGVKKYLERYAFQNVRVVDFLDEMEAVCDCNLDTFKKEQLDTAKLNTESIVSTFSAESVFIQNMQLAQKVALHMYAKDYLKAEEALQQFIERMKTDSYFPFYDVAINAFSNNFDSEARKLYKRLLPHKNLELQKAIARYLAPYRDYYQAYVLLFRFPSYELHRETLQNLWTNFDEKRMDVLDFARKLPSFQKDVGFRVLWNRLMLQTEMEASYFALHSDTWKNDLDRYTEADKPFYERMYAFEQLRILNQWRPRAVKNILEACTHHAWRFTSEVRNLSKVPEVRTAIRKVYPLIEKELSFAAKNYYNKALKEGS